MKTMAELMPVLARGNGRWIGVYTHLDLDRVVLDQYEVRCRSTFPSDGRSDYQLETHNRWPDGRETRAVHLADYRDGRLWWRGDLTGWMSEVDDATIYLRYGYRADPSITVFEMIQVSQDGYNRARTWHWFRDDAPFKITLTQERRDDAS